MSCRFPCLVALLFAFTAGGVSTAHAWQPSRLTMLAARDDLRDQVCIALAMDGGRISHAKRLEILGDAKEILSPKEYDAFRRALDRISVPPRKKDPAVAKKAAQLAKKKAASSFTRRKAFGLLARVAPAESAKSPAMPKTVERPDRVASKGIASKGTVR